MGKNKNASASPVPGAKKEAKTMRFPDALEAVIDGKSVRREEWADQGEHCVLKDSYLMIHRNGKFHAWIISEGDLLATDWVIA